MKPPLTNPPTGLEWGADYDTPQAYARIGRALMLFLFNAALDPACTERIAWRCAGINRVNGARPKLLPCRGLGTGILRALREYQAINFVDDSSRCDQAASSDIIRVDTRPRAQSDPAIAPRQGQCRPFISDAGPVSPRQRADRSKVISAWELKP